MLEALTEDGYITDLGIQMSRFPLEPQFAKCLITSALFEIPDKMITLVSMLSTESIWKKVLKVNEEEYESFLANSKQFLS